MASRNLPARNKRPPKSEELKRFERALDDLNNFYWATMAGFYMLRHQRPVASTETNDFLPPTIARRLQVSVQELDAFLDNEEKRLRQLSLVNCVTYYEEYLRDTVAATLREKHLPTGKRPRIEVPFDSIPASGDVKSFILDLWATQTANSVVSSGYEERPRQTDKALGIDILKGGSEHGLDLLNLKCACLFRNSIVHNGGVVDQRTLQGVDGHIPNLAAGSTVPLDEKLLFDFFEALLAHARDVDLLVRIGASQ